MVLYVAPGSSGGRNISLARGETVVEVQRNPTREVRIGSISIGAGHPIAPQSMTATHTADVAATLEQTNALHAAGAGVVRIAVDSKSDAAALPAIRAGTAANLAIDLQENYRLALEVAPHVDKLRYNPGQRGRQLRQRRPCQEGAVCCRRLARADARKRPRTL